MVILVKKLAPLRLGLSGRTAAMPARLLRRAYTEHGKFSSGCSGSPLLFCKG